MAESSTSQARVVIIDLRCLQDMGAAEMDYARRLVIERPAAVRLVGLVDERLATVPVEILQGLDAVRADAYFPALLPGSVFLNPSPTATDPLFVARLLLNAQVMRVALVDDLSGVDAGPTLRQRARRIARLTRLAWVGQYDLLLPAATPAAAVWASVLTIPGKVNIGGAKPRVAVMSPFPPVPSGVADYSAACAAKLQRYVDLVLFSAQENPPALGGLAIAPLSALAHMLPNIDRVVSVLGNSRYHTEIYDLLIRHGAAAICHDARLLHFQVEKNGFTAAAGLASAELGREVGEAELAGWLQDESRREATLLGEAARHAEPLIFHNMQNVQLARSRFGVRPRYLPFAVQREFSVDVLDAGARLAAKRRLGLDPSQIHIASFGYLTADKGVDVVMAALRQLVRWGHDVHLHWVGEASAASAAAAISQAGPALGRHLSRPTGFVSEARFRDYLVAADLGLQLRRSGVGGISGALQDSITAALPSVASESLAGGLDAPDYVTRVADDAEAAEIAGALAQLIENPPRRLPAQWADYCDARSMARYAEGLLKILEV